MERLLNRNKIPILLLQRYYRVWFLMTENFMVAQRVQLKFYSVLDITNESRSTSNSLHQADKQNLHSGSDTVGGMCVPSRHPYQNSS